MTTQPADHARLHAAVAAMDPDARGGMMQANYVDPDMDGAIDTVVVLILVRVALGELDYDGVLAFCERARAGNPPPSRREQRAWRRTIRAREAVAR